MPHCGQVSIITFIQKQVSESYSFFGKVFVGSRQATDHEFNKVPVPVALSRVVDNLLPTFRLKILCFD